MTTYVLVVRYDDIIREVGRAYHLFRYSDEKIIEPGLTHATLEGLAEKCREAGIKLIKTDLLTTSTAPWHGIPVSDDELQKSAHNLAA